jgi:hypothetical protein
MPKKTASARGGASRNKPKPQKSIQLVRPDATVKNDVAVNENDIQQDESSEEETTLAASTPALTSKAAVASAATVSKTEVATSKKSEIESVPSQKEQTAVDSSAANKGSAAARLAARRQAVLKPQASRNASLITAEHYAYVRRDLIYILILAIIMFSAIIILHFVPAIGG